jgi:hypothetical protein
VKQRRDPDEVRRRLSRAELVIDLGAGSLLGPSQGAASDEEADKSLERLLARMKK